MNSEIKHITDHINKLSLQERYDICKIIEFYQTDILQQTNNGAYALFENSGNHTILKVDESVKK